MSLSQVVVPTYPGFEIEVEALRERPEIIAEATVPATLDHLSDVIESVGRPPIIMGHSFGGPSPNSWSTEGTVPQP